MRTVLMIYFTLLGVLTIKSQTIVDYDRIFFTKSEQTQLNKKSRYDNRQRKLTKVVERYVQKYNQENKPLVVMKFSGFRVLSEELKKDLDIAFKNHTFTVAKTLIYHHTWTDGIDLIIMTERKSGRLVIFSPSPLDGSGNAFGPLENVLTFYPAKSTADAYFKVQTLSTILSIWHKGRVGEIKSEGGIISTLICHGQSAVTTMRLGLVFKVKISERLRFGKLYFENNEWMMNKCST
jgi:hypothetical protein